jgi:aspartate racemase
MFHRRRVDSDFGIHGHSLPAGGVVRKEQAMIGVLGGMGPAATIDFMEKIIRLTPAELDHDHLPLVVMSDPRVPDRVAPILKNQGPSPAEAMVRGATSLKEAGAGCIAIPCHTAHF